MDIIINPRLANSSPVRTGHTFERVKTALLRDWDQTRHNLGGNAPDLHQGLRATISEIVGTAPVPPRGTPIN